MQVIVDSSIWIDYFRDGGKSKHLDFLIDENLVMINDLILAELIPFLKIRNQIKIISLLKSIDRLDMDIQWDKIIEYQYRCSKNGINGIGLPDLMIAQNAIQNHCGLYSLDHHFKMMEKMIDIKLIT
jgi:predicted nucleic acid-binding protein